MGEIAEMMLEGDLCEGCGSFIDFDGGDGIPRYCSPTCAKDRGAYYAKLDRYEPRVPAYRRPQPNTKPATDPKMANCPTCKKQVKAVGLSMHRRDAHGEAA